MLSKNVIGKTKLLGVQSFMHAFDFLSQMSVTAHLIVIYIDNSAPCRDGARALQLCGQCSNL